MLKLFKKRDQFDNFPNLINSFGDILHDIHDEIDKLYKQPVIKDKETFAFHELLKLEGKVLNPKDKTKLRSTLNSLADQIDHKLKTEINRLIKVLSKKLNSTTEYGACLFFYRHYKKKQSG